MDEKVEKEDVTNLKDAITDEVEFELDTDELGKRVGEIFGSISSLRAEVTNMGSGVTNLKQSMQEMNKSGNQGQL